MERSGHLYIITAVGHCSQGDHVFRLLSLSWQIFSFRFFQQNQNNKKKVAWDPKSKLKAKTENVYIDDEVGLVLVILSNLLAQSLFMFQKSSSVPEGSGSGTPVPTDMDVESSGLGPDDEDALAKSWGSGRNFRLPSNFSHSPPYFMPFYIFCFSFLMRIFAQKSFWDS